MTSIQNKKLSAFNKRKQFLNSKLVHIELDVDVVLHLTDDEYNTVMMYMKKCKLLRDTYKRLTENNTIINTSEPTSAPAPDPTPAPAPTSEPAPDPTSEPETAPEPEPEPTPDPTSEPVIKKTKPAVIKKTKPAVKKSKPAVIKKSKSPVIKKSKPAVIKKSKREPIMPELKKINLKTNRIKFIKFKNSTIQLFIIEFKDAYNIADDITPENVQPLYDKIDISNFELTEKQETQIKKEKHIDWINAEIIERGIDKELYNNLAVIYNEKIAHLSLALGKHTLIQQILTDNLLSETDKPTVEFFCKNNIYLDTDISQTQYDELREPRNDDKSECKIREPAKVKFTISLKDCIKENDTLKENIEELRKSMTPEDRPRIKKQIKDLKMKLVYEYCGYANNDEFKKLRDELTMLKYESRYGDGSNLDDLNVRMSWVISRLDTLSNPREHRDIQ